MNSQILQNMKYVYSKNYNVGFATAAAVALIHYKFIADHMIIINTIFNLFRTFFVSIDSANLVWAIMKFVDFHPTFRILNALLNWMFHEMVSVIEPLKRL